MFHHFVMPSGIRETIDAKISREMPLPIPLWVISSPIHIRIVQPAVSVTTIRKTLGKVRAPITLWPPKLEELKRKV